MLTHCANQNTGTRERRFHTPLTIRPDKVVPAVPITLFTAYFIDPEQVVDNSEAAGAEAGMLFLQPEAESSPAPQQSSVGIRHIDPPQSNAFTRPE